MLKVRTTVRDFIQKRLDRVISLAEKEALEVETEAKANAPWKDHTELSRSTLTPFIFGGVHNVEMPIIDKTGTEIGMQLLVGKSIGFGLAYQVVWGVFLEYANDGKYGIVDKTVGAHLSKFLQEAKKILEGRDTRTKLH